MRGLAGLFALAGKLHEVVSFGLGALGNGQFLIGGCQSVIEAGYGGDQPAAGNFHLSGGNGRSRICAANAGDLGKADVFVDHSLAEVFVHGIVRDENRRLRADALARFGDHSIGLRIEALVVIDNAGQQAGAGNGRDRDQRPCCWPRQQRK